MAKKKRKKQQGGGQQFLSPERYLREQARTLEIGTCYVTNDIDEMKLGHVIVTLKDARRAVMMGRSSGTTSPASCAGMTTTPAASALSCGTGPTTPTTPAMTLARPSGSISMPRPCRRHHRGRTPEGPPAAGRLCGPHTPLDAERPCPGRDVNLPCALFKATEIGQIFGGPK